ncbi:MAG: exodeoxyribonuclease VII large subunit [Thermaerobacterales bacterium]
MDHARILTISELTRYLKSLLDRDPVLQETWVRGELSNFRHHSSGHMYFTLKDSQSALSCVMFRGANRRLKFTPESGMQVIAGGHVSIYERNGAYQLYTGHLEPDGLGALQVGFEQLKVRLRAAGLFDESRKRPLPMLPRRVGIVTSPTGAALRDIIKVIRRRFPKVELVVYPAIVQGEEAPAQIVKGLDMLNLHGSVDVIIIGRGGGSLEDLWAFNDEGVAHAVYRSAAPVVSAVGHETDITISDFVADVRAPTPSAAAALVVPDERALRSELRQWSHRLAQGLRARLGDERHRLARTLTHRFINSPIDRIMQNRQQIDDLSRRGAATVERCLERRRGRLESGVGRLQALSPLAILARGYSVARLLPEGRAIDQAGDVSPGDNLELLVRRGRIHCVVERVHDTWEEVAE